MYNYVVVSFLTSIYIIFNNNNKAISPICCKFKIFEMELLV